MVTGKITYSGSIFASPLFRRFLVPILLTMLAFSFSVYFYAVPYLKNLVYSLEEKAVKTDLDNIHSLIKANYLAIDAYKNSVTFSHKKQLMNMTLFMETYLKTKYQQVQEGLVSEEEAQWAALEELRNFRYGKNDYVWVADYKGFYLSHPDPTMNMEDFSGVRDVFGNFVLMPLIQQAREKGEGYHTFWWQRLENDLPAEKLAYAKLFPQWEWVIGTGVYLDELETEILMRKEKMIRELHDILKPITIAKTGYLYIFDAWGNIIIHPDSQLENTDMSSWINPESKNRLVDDLKTVSHSASHKISYKWDKVDDKDNFIYGKTDWVTHVEEFDWYVVASVYSDELTESSTLLRNRILFLAIGVVLLSVLIVSILMTRLLNPIRLLSQTASLVESGDLSAKSDIEGDDEIGFLARSFNLMVAQLRSNIQELDKKVLDRTRRLNNANNELLTTVKKLEKHNQQVTMLNNMSEDLQGCHSLQEIYVVLEKSLTLLFQSGSGVLYIVQTNGAECDLKKTVSWGEGDFHSDNFTIGDCKAISKGKSRIVEIQNTLEPCHFVQVEQAGISICIPLLGQNEIHGVVNIVMQNDSEEAASSESSVPIEEWQRLATTISDYLSLAISNMKLQERLQNLSVRDGLTGLFNRRYMEETLSREFSKAERDEYPVGVIMLDVDFFKKFNDTYGHEAGDIVLIELSKLLVKSVRKEDVVCRYGGEEFVVILPGPLEDQSIKRAEIIRSRVEKELKIRYNDHDIRVTISLGAAFYPDHGATPEEVLKAADTALYVAKEEGRNRAVSA